MMNLHRRISRIALGAMALSLSGLGAAAHSGSHVGADHSHFFYGGEILILVALAAGAAMWLHNRSR